MIFTWAAVGELRLRTRRKLQALTEVRTRMTTHKMRRFGHAEWPEVRPPQAHSFQAISLLPRLRVSTPTIKGRLQGTRSCRNRAAPPGSDVPIVPATPAEGVPQSPTTGASGTSTAFVGLRRRSPSLRWCLLLFESIWKLLLLAAVALPAIMDNAVDPAMSELKFNCSMVVIDLGPSAGGTRNNDNGISSAHCGPFAIKGSLLTDGLSPGSDRVGKGRRATTGTE
jgi:hypothetical protein